MARSLIQWQDEAIQQMMQPRTSEKRAAKHRAAVLRAYRRNALRLGYTIEQAEQQSRDVLDMYRLEVRAGE